MPPKTNQPLKSKSPKARAPTKATPKSGNKVPETQLSGISNTQKAKKLEIEETARRVKDSQEKLRDEAKKPTDFDRTNRRYPSKMENKLQLLQLDQIEMTSNDVEFIKESIVQNMIKQQLSVLIYDPIHITNLLRDISKLDMAKQMDLLRFFVYSTFVGIENSNPPINEPVTLDKINVIYNNYPNLSYGTIDSYLTNEINNRIKRRIYPSLSVQTMPNVIDIDLNAPKVDFEGILGGWGPLPNTNATLIQPIPENIMTNDPLMLKRAYSKGMAELHTTAFITISKHLNELINPVKVLDQEKMEAIRQRLMATLKKGKKDSTVDEESEDESEDESESDSESDVDDFIDDTKYSENGNSPSVYKCSTCNDEITGTPRKSIISSNGKYIPVYFCPDGECLDNYKEF